MEKINHQKIFLVLLISCQSMSESYTTGNYNEGFSALIDIGEITSAWSVNCSEIMEFNKYSLRQCMNRETQGAVTQAEPDTFVNQVAEKFRQMNIIESNEASTAKSSRPAVGTSDQQTEQNVADKFSCKDNEGAAVDWFIAIMKDKSKKYVFITDKSVESRATEWIDGNDISSSSPIAATLQQAFDEKAKPDRQSILHAYSDHSPQGNASPNGGHMKGVVLYGTDGKNTGFWMTHSLPQFPDFNNDNLIWPANNNKGQSFFCATFKKYQLEEVLKIISFAEPNFYFGSPAEARGEKITRSAVNTSGGESLDLIVKSPNDQVKIYEYFEPKEIKVQTHRLGASPPLPYSENVKNVAFTKFTQEFGLMSFTKDQSKWSISVHPKEGNQPEKYRVCVGDLNRVEDHYKNRGGCVLCLENQDVYNLFNKAINDGQSEINQADQPQQNQPAPDQPILQNQALEYSCMLPSETGGIKVDWFLLVKQAGGCGYRYLSSNDNGNEWVPGYNVAENGPLKQTLQQAYDDIHGFKQANIYAYNDHIPGKKSAARNGTGHAKGFVMFGPSRGFWLIHSKPEFPNLIQREYNYTVSNNIGSEMAQMFFCVNLGISEAAYILHQIKIMKPPDYFSPISLPNFDSLQGMPLIQSIQLNSLNGVEFIHIVKHPEYEEDIYEILSNLLDRKLHVRVFTGAPGDYLPSNRIDQCKKYLTYFYINPSDLWRPVSGGNDHTKWCITQDQEMAYFCIGDLNRKEPQTRRGGGVLCFRNLPVYNKFKKIIETHSENKTRLALQHPC